MFDPKASRHPKPNTLASPKSTRAKVAPISGTVPLPDQIRERAHQLYEIRGREHGKDEQDWLRAEHEILNEHR